MVAAFVLPLLQFRKEMKPRSSTIAFCALIIIFITLVILSGRKKALKTPPVVPIEANIATRTNTQVTSPVPRSQNTGSLADVIKEYRQGLMDKGKAMQAVLSEYNDVPIDFYGKLED